MRIISIRNALDEPFYLLVDVRAIFFRFSDRRPRASTPLRPFDARAESFVVRIKEEEKIFRVWFVARLIIPQDGFEEPRRVADVPAGRTHELSRLNYVVFNLQRGDDFQRARADGFVKLRH